MGWKNVASDILDDVGRTRPGTITFEERLSIRPLLSLREPTAEELVRAHAASERPRLPPRRRRSARVLADLALTKAERRHLVAVMLGITPSKGYETRRTHGKKCVAKLGTKGGTCAALALRILVSQLAPRDRVSWAMDLVQTYERRRGSP